MRLLAELRKQLSAQSENDEHGYENLETTRTWRQRRRNYTFGFRLDGFLK